MFDAYKRDQQWFQNLLKDSACRIHLLVPKILNMAGFRKQRWWWRILLATIFVMCRRHLKFVTHFWRNVMLMTLRSTCHLDVQFVLSPTSLWTIVNNIWVRFESIILPLLHLEVEQGMRVYKPACLDSRTAYNFQWRIYCHLFRFSSIKQSESVR